MNDWRFWVLLVLSLAVVGITIYNMSLQNGIVRLSSEVGERQNFITQSVQLGQVNQNLIQGVANVAAQANDSELRELLNRNGVTYSVTTSAQENTDVQ